MSVPGLRVQVVKADPLGSEAEPAQVLLTNTRKDPNNIGSVWSFEVAQETIFIQQVVVVVGLYYHKHARNTRILRISFFILELFFKKKSLSSSI